MFVVQKKTKSASFAAERTSVMAHGWKLGAVCMV